MKTLGKVLAGVLVLVLLLAGAGLAWLYTTYPKVGPAETVTIVATPEKVARGQYLFENVSNCVACHSDRDWEVFGAPVVANTRGKGGQRFGFGAEPFVLYAKNITPGGVGEWSDGELLRAITTGVSRDGTPLFPLMPYPRYARMAREDIEAIIVYLRTLPRIAAQELPARSLKFPLPLIVRTIPTAAAHQPVPPTSDRVAYGRYMTNAAACGDCHTPIDAQGAPLPGMDFAGGMAFTPNGSGLVRSANLTPDAGTGLGTWSEDQFVEKFRAFRSTPPPRLEGAARLQNTEMPWTTYAGMSDDDLRAIYSYLRSLPPVVNRVEKFATP